MSRPGELTPCPRLARYSIGVGDRFGHQAAAQLRACMLARDQGVSVTPVWNKSNREHTIIGSEPQSVRAAADAAVKSLNWTGDYYVDADHINLATVDRFFAPSDFFTIDVADLIGRPAEAASIQSFVQRHAGLLGRLQIPGVAAAFTLDQDFLEQVAAKYLAAVEQAGRIYRHIAEKKGDGTFIAEISMDETDAPQTPAALLLILAAIAGEQIPIQTIAPKFNGRFNKGVDYVGDLARFRQEFSDDVAVIAFAIEEFGLPANLKLSVHSGSDKFSIYPAIRETVQSRDAGVHLKTAGTTWLEELIGLAESGGSGLAAAQEIYAEGYSHRAELCAPYSSVIEIDPAKLPPPSDVDRWSAQQYVAALRHDPASPAYNPSLRQLLHVGFKLAANMGGRYLELLRQNETVIARNVTENLYDRHIRPVFIG